MIEFSVLVNRIDEKTKLEDIVSAIYSEVKRKKNCHKQRIS